MATVERVPMTNGQKRVKIPLYQADSSSNEYDPDERYPEFEVGRGLTVQLMWITPELAGEWLTRLHPKQRSKKKHHLLMIQDDLNNDRWMLNGETISFDTEGRLIDGQHRLDSVVKTGKPILTLVVRGVRPHAYVSIGNTTKRQLGDALAASGHARPRSLGAAAVLLVRYERGMLNGMGHTAQLVLSPQAGDEVLKMHPGLEDSLIGTVAAGRFMHSDAGVAFCHYILAAKDAKAAATFFSSLATGENLEKGNAILALRSKIILENERNKNRRRGPFITDDVIKLVFKTWNSWRTGKDVMVLSLKEDEKLVTPV